MPVRLPSDLLDRSAQEAPRLLALSYLAEIDQARARLGDALDEEALHDFRVGLRRLRSAIRAYRPELESSVPGRMRRRLRDLARATNDGRDVEVQIAWLAKQAGRLEPEEIPGFFWLVGRLEARKEKTHERATADVARRYDQAAGKLRKALGILRIELQTGPGQRLQTFRELTGTLARIHTEQVRSDLRLIQGPGDAEQAHRTRISLKRLRYLLEPVARRNRRAGALVRRFKEAQDQLGDHHDMHVLSSTIAFLREDASAGKFPELDRGLGTLARLAEASAAGAFDRFQASWSGDAGNRILARADELGQLLVQGPPPPDSSRGRDPSAAIPGAPTAIPPAEPLLRGREPAGVIPHESGGAFDG